MFRPNQMPVADAGPDQIVQSFRRYPGWQRKHDPDGDLPLAYLWVQSVVTAVTLSGDTTARPTFTAPAVASQTVTLSFTLV